jgi:hypothetical protein
VERTKGQILEILSRKLMLKVKTRLIKQTSIIVLIPTKTQHPNQQGQGNKNFKKQNWQDKKRQKNKPRPKFKKPRKLPYEDTESKPLELGNLLEFETLKDRRREFLHLLKSLRHLIKDPINFNELYSGPSRIKGKSG